MNRYLLSFFVALLISVNLLMAQNKMIELKPIHVQGWRYYYDFKRVNSPYALQIPFQSIEDDEVSIRFKRFTTYQTIRGLGYLASIIYLLSANSYSQSSAEVFVGLTLGAIALDLGLNVASHAQLRKGAERYNLLILQPGAGNHSNDTNYGLGFSYRLK